MRACRTRAVELSAERRLAEVFTGSKDALESQVYVVKLLDVHPALGKVAGRRLMGSLGLDQFVRACDLESVHVDKILAACGESV